MQIRHEQGNEGGEFVLDFHGHRAGELTYSLSGDVITVRHTGVDPAHEGRGYGKRLVSEVVAFARQNNFTMRSTCWFATRLLDKVPDFADITAPS